MNKYLWENWFVHCLKTQYFKFHSKSWKPINAYSNLHNEFGVSPWRKSANQMWIQLSTFLSKPRNKAKKKKPKPSFNPTQRLKFSIFYSVRLQTDNKNCYRSITLNNTHCHLGRTFRLSSGCNLLISAQEWLWRPQF